MATGGVNESDIVSDETFDQLCSLCRKKNKNTEATKFCLDCPDHYCFKCVVFHDDVPALSKHKIVEIDQFKPGLKLIPTERCDKHDHKHVDTYCKNHDLVGCSTCMNIDHRSCKDIFFIPDFIKTNVDQLDPQAINQGLETSTEILYSQHKQVQVQREALLKNKIVCLKKMNEFHADMNKKLNQLKKITANDIEDIYKPQLDKLDNQIALIEETTLKVSMAKDDLLHANKNESQKFVSCKKAKLVADNARQSVDNIKHGETGKGKDFVRDRSLTEMMYEIAALGETSDIDLGPLMQKITFDSEQTGSFKGNSNTSSKQNFPNKVQAVLVKNTKEYPIKLRSDEMTCRVTCICIVNDKTIIIADYHNDKVKRINNSTYTVTDHCDISDPYKVCKVNETEIAVSCCKNQIIQFISVKEKMIRTRTIETDHDCYGLTYSFGTLYISDETSVYKYAESGDMLGEVDINQKRVYGINSLAASSDGSLLFLADSSGIFTVNIDENVTRKINCPELKYVADVCTTDHDDVILCTQNTILRLKFDCNLIKKVLKCDDDVTLQAICCDLNHSKIFTGFYMKDSIDVHEIADKAN